MKLASRICARAREFTSDRKTFLIGINRFSRGMQKWIRLFYFYFLAKKKNLLFSRTKKIKNRIHFWIPLEKSLIPIKKVFRSDVNPGAREHFRDTSFS